MACTDLSGTQVRTPGPAETPEWIAKNEVKKAEKEQKKADADKKKKVRTHAPAHQGTSERVMWSLL